MAAEAEALEPDQITWHAACRENTGAAMCDSGGAYGRHHEQEPIPETTPIVEVELWGDPPGVDLTINTAAYMTETMEIDHEMQEAWNRFDDLFPEMSWFDSARRFLMASGYVAHHRDNVYNSDNDFSQVWIYEVWEKQREPQFMVLLSDFVELLEALRDSETRRCDSAAEDIFRTLDSWYEQKPDQPHGDWINLTDDEETVVVIHIHTGCDVRGGYGRPVFCHSTGEYAIPVEWSVEMWACELLDKPGEEWRNNPEQKRLQGTPEYDPHELLRSLDERWSTSYSAWPKGKFEEDIEAIEPDSLQVDEHGVPTVIAQHKDGHRIRVAFSAATHY